MGTLVSPLCLSCPYEVGHSLDWMGCQCPLAVGGPSRAPVKVPHEKKMTAGDASKGRRG